MSRYKTDPYPLTEDSDGIVFRFSPEISKRFVDLKAHRQELSEQRKEAINLAKEHIDLAIQRLEVARRLLDDPGPGDLLCDEPDDLSVAHEAVGQAASCVAVAFTELDRGRYLP